MNLTPEATRRGYERMFAAMKIRPEKQAKLDAVVKVILRGRSRYEAVEKETGVPWWFIGIIHMREASCNFKTYLGNGEPLTRTTRLVPKGRGPFASWEAGAIDALKLEGLNAITDWSLPTALFNFEKYNGFGYISKAVNSPYVWAWTTNYTRGKFIADGKFSASTIDPQPGCAAMLQILIATGLIPALINKVIPMAIDTINNAINPAPAPVATPSAVPSAGVTISKAQNLATHILAGLGALFAASGLTQVHTFYDAVTSSSLLGGLIVSGLAMLISHFNVNGSNDNTLDLVDKIVTALTPAQPHVSLMADAAVHDDHAAA